MNRRKIDKGVHAIQMVAAFGGCLWLFSTTCVVYWIWWWLMLQVVVTVGRIK